jgi:hypothetical protein
MKNVKLGVGLENLKFGLTREEVIAAIGEPDEIEKFNSEEEEDGQSEAWHYDELDLSATFDELDDWKLTSLAVSSPEYLFEGINLIGLSQQEVVQQIETMDLGEIEIEEITDEEGAVQELGSLPEVSLNLWFENGSLTEVQWGPFWDDEDEGYNWPE